MNTERELRFKNITENLSKQILIPLEQVAMSRVQNTKNETPVFRKLSLNYLCRSKRKPNVNDIFIIKKHLQRYNSGKETYNIKKVNEIVYDECKHIVTVFKDQLIWDDVGEFLLR
jgi:hypothetical protein